MSNVDLPVPLSRIADLILILYEAAANGSRAAARRGWRLQPQRQRNFALKPGPATPLWNELVRQSAPFLRKRGTKAHLSRILGVPRQRLQDSLKARTACLDAERTLLLLGWLAAQKQGRELTA